MAQPGFLFIRNETMWTEQQLEELLQSLLQEIMPKKRFTVLVEWGTGKSLRHTIRMEKRKHLQVRISPKMAQAPEDVLKALSMLLLAKIFRFKADSAFRKKYNTYVDEHILPHMPAVKRRISPRYTPEGSYFNLKQIFNELNRNYFNASLPEPILGWSLQPAYTRLGFYDWERNLLVISRIFDHRKTPREAVEFLMYHEMLHIYLPVRAGKGRRRMVHTAEFKRLERQFPNYEEIEKWIKRKRHRL